MNMTTNREDTMVEDLVILVQGEDSRLVISNLYQDAVMASSVGWHLCSLDSQRDVRHDNQEDVFDMTSKMADILYDIGMIHGAQYLNRMEMWGDDSEEGMIKEIESERSEAKTYLEQSVHMRKKGFSADQDSSSSGNLEFESLTAAIGLYELGRLFSVFVLRMNLDQQDSIMSSISKNARKNALQECATAVSYFEEARSIFQDNMGMIDTTMIETFNFVDFEDGPWIARLDKIPVVYEEMLQMMAILYRKLGEYGKSVECYNEVSILLTRMELEDGNDEDSDESMITSQKEKVAFYSERIGDILFDTGEYLRALESYDEALQFRRLQDADSLVVADTLCRKGQVSLKLQDWNQALLSFNEALRIRVDLLPKDHDDVAACFHSIGKAYEGHRQLEQALDYYKKAQRILSGNLLDRDTNAADLFYDLGNIVLIGHNSYQHMQCKAPSEDDISLALTCLALSRDIYRRNFGDDALEVGNTLCLLGVIYAIYDEYTMAIASYEDALSIFRGAPLDQSLRIAKALDRLGMALFHCTSKSNTKNPLDYLELSRQIYVDKKECKGEDYAIVLLHLGMVYVQEGKVTHHHNMLYVISLLANLHCLLHTLLTGL
jgi:tetratricopeptide (TPR) repeat protein